jgi:hypothetical protein
MNFSFIKLLVLISFFLRKQKQKELEQKACSSARDQIRSDQIIKSVDKACGSVVGWGVAAMHGTQPTKYKLVHSTHINTRIYEYYV